MTPATSACTTPSWTRARGGDAAAARARAPPWARGGGRVRAQRAHVQLRDTARRARVTHPRRRRRWPRWSARPRVEPTDRTFALRWRRRRRRSKSRTCAGRQRRPLRLGSGVSQRVQTQQPRRVFGADRARARAAAAGAWPAEDAVCRAGRSSGRPGPPPAASVGRGGDGGGDEAPKTSPRGKSVQPEKQRAQRRRLERAHARPRAGSRGAGRAGARARRRGAGRLHAGRRSRRVGVRRAATRAANGAAATATPSPRILS